MEILVFSDSHTDTQTMGAVIDRVRPDAVIHLGDHIVDAILLQRRYPGIRFEMVAGNTDTGSHPSQKIIKLDSATAFLAHGHEYHVEDGPSRLLVEGRQAGTRIVLYGHTHKPALSTEQGILIMNPGRIGRISSKQINASFGIIRVQGEDVSANIYSYDATAGKEYLGGEFAKDCGGSRSW